MNELFNARSLYNKCTEEYNRRYYPNTILWDKDRYAEKNGLKTVKYKELGNEEIWGMPYAFCYGDNGELEVTFQDSAHTLVVGTTQVGKTWGHVMDSVHILSSKKNRANLMITDPKGEIWENTAYHLKKKGYRIYAVNFKNPGCSNMWNPLIEIYDKWMELNAISGEPVFHGTLKNMFNYILEDNVSDFVKNKYFWSFENKAYVSLEKAREAIDAKKGTLYAETTGMVNQLAVSMGTEALTNTKDAIWVRGAIDILKGMIYLMLEDALDKRSGFTRDNMNFMNMQRYYEIIREGLGAGTVGNPLLQIPKLMHKNPTDLSVRCFRAYFENASTTARSYMGVFENIMQEWFTPKIYAMANTNNIDLFDEDGSPFAVFLITRDYEKSDYIIAGLFVDWIYKNVLNKFDENGGKTERETFFLLDEFANIPVINGFTNKISTALSRKIIFQLYVQSYEQLESNYGFADAGTIRANCNVELFLGSRSMKTKKEFSDQCGTKRVESPDTAPIPDRKMMIEIPVLSVNTLESLERGECFMKRLNKPVSRTRFEMAFNCKELDIKKTAVTESVTSSKPYVDKSFFYKYLEDNRSMDFFSRFPNLKGNIDKEKRLS